MQLYEREVRWAWKILLPENGPGLVGWGGGQSVEEEEHCGKKQEEQEEEKKMQLANLVEKI